VSSHIARRMGFSSDVIAQHLLRRRLYFRGFPIDRFVFEGRRGVAREIEAGRFRPRETRRPERPLFRTPERKGGWGIFPRPVEGPSIFPGRGRERPRMFNPRV